TMHDPRIDKLARVITEYSTRVQPGQLVRISGEPGATPLIEALYERVLLADAHPMVRCAPDSLQEIFFTRASDEQLKHVNPLTLEEIKRIDVSIGIWAEANTRALSRIDPKRQSIASAARRPIMEIFMDRAAKGELHWCGTQFPTIACAQDAEMSLRQYEDFVFSAGKLEYDDPVAEWRKIEEKQQKVVDYLKDKKELRFQAANGTDLTVNVEGMTWINCAGRENFPDGEVFTGPNLKAKDGGVNGVVRYSFPAVHHGREVHEIELTFEKGKVVQAKAGKGEDFLLQMLDQDEGARFLGEIAIGTNYDITEYTRNTLFDEKIGGTFHAAVGAGYPETGNANQSGLHWDMVCDLRQAAGGGTISADGETFHRDGQFLIAGW
ncbi:MAG: aminopeptidase, partial [Hyphomicrobiales bacterium]